MHCSIFKHLSCQCQVYQQTDKGKVSKGAYSLKRRARASICLCSCMFIPVCLTNFLLLHAKANIFRFAVDPSNFCEQMKMADHEDLLLATAAFVVLSLMEEKKKTVLASIYI